MKVTMYYDDKCPICTAEAKTLASHSDNIHIIGVHDALDELERAGFSYQDVMTYVCVKDEHGRWYTAMDAIRVLYQVADLPLSKFLNLPIVKPLSDKLYPVIARNRYRIPKSMVRLFTGKKLPECENGVCHLPPHQR
ncbi:thiol-disulfide oxidoreductase DCC family protein [Moraxella sp. ZY210820]|uniref:thiol-disulfide oxidoreductase DCC family protein n=1 Tax=unclassified Moraxella TaxID=2685852 RepID=UPI00272FF2CB|nr:DUF393 domain-containing protein [Moraxella sp. ZY210820]WLF83642.1 DUF393 domain-containing protein [Moraxella sp. ZY210820]